MSLPLLVFPMAGLSKRFSDAGFNKPKYMLPLHGLPVFDQVLLGFRNYFLTHQFLFVYRDIQDTGGFIARRTELLGIPSSNVTAIQLDNTTSGQSETVALGLELAELEVNRPLSIFNIDTIHHKFNYPESSVLEADGYIEVFTADGDQWSFVEPDFNGRVKRVTEKIRISDLCSTGLYHFKSSKLFLDTYKRTQDVPVADLMGRERYVAPLYNLLIADGCDIRFVKVERDEISLCGVPDDYRLLIEKDELR